MSMTLPLPNPVPTSNGARLVAPDGRELPLRHVALDGDAAGGLARTTVRQVFANPYDVPLHLSYQLPLPPDGAVVGFSFTLGDRRITGRVERKADAREAFERAVVEGRTAALLEQDRSSLFHQELGNVPPRTEITCEIEVEHLLAWRDGGWSWRFPTVVAPRFLGTPGQTRDPGRVSVDVLDGDAPARASLTLRIGEAQLAPPTSPTHAIDLATGACTLGADARLDRDVVVAWKPAVGALAPAVEVCGDGNTAWAQLTLVPPTPETRPAPVPRDLILLLDISGSMGGRPLDQLKAFCRALVKGLGPADRLEMIAFASHQQAWASSPTAMSASARASALAWLEALQAGGGTWMHEAILAALKPLRAEAQRQVVLITDGLIGFEDQIVGTIRTALPASSRVHTIGVGSSVNRSLTAPSARAGAGLELVLGLDEGVESPVAALLARTEAPVVVDLAIRGRCVRRVAPLRVPDLFAGAPTRLWVEVDPAGGALELTGRTAAGPWRAMVEVPAAVGGRKVVGSRFARERIEDLELEAAATPSAAIDAEIEGLALRHHLASRLTSWVAETADRTVDPSDPTRRVEVPQALPYGMSAEGVGLRGAMAPQPQVFAMSAAPMPARAMAPASAPMAPPPPRGAPKEKRMEAQKSAAPMGGVARRMRAAFDSIFGDSPADEEAEPPMVVGEIRQRLVQGTATIRSRADGHLVLELVFDGVVDWDAGATVTAELPGGTTVEVPVATGTTRPAPIGAGITIRLVLAWSGADPVRVRVAGHLVEVRG